jgi:hypothetical protein
MWFAVAALPPFPAIQIVPPADETSLMAWASLEMSEKGTSEIALESRAK